MAMTTTTTTTMMASATNRKQREMSQQRGPQQQQSMIDCKIHPLSPSLSSATNPFWKTLNKKRPSSCDAEEEEEKENNERLHKKSRFNNDNSNDGLLLAASSSSEVELKNKRCQNVFKFLTVRGLMLMNANTTTAASDAAAPALPLSRKQRLATTLLQQIIPNMETFQFHDYFTPTTTSTTTTPTTSMSEWDMVLKQRLIKKFGPLCCDRLVTYKLHDGMKGITYHHNNNTTAEVSAKVDIMIRTGGSNQTVLTGLLSLYFQPDSTYLDNVSWSTIRDYIDDDNEEQLHHHNQVYSSLASSLAAAANTHHHAPAPAPE